MWQPSWIFGGHIGELGEFLTLYSVNGNNLCTNFGNSTVYIQPGRQSEKKTGTQKNLGTSGQKFFL